MSDVKPTPAAKRPDPLYHAKGPQNDGGYAAAGQQDDLFRDGSDPFGPADPPGDAWRSKGPQNDGGYGVRSAIAKEAGATRPEGTPAAAADPLFTDRVDIQFKKPRK